MASYPTVLPARTNAGFPEGMGRGLEKDASVYSQAAMTEIFPNKKDERERLRKEKSAEKKKGAYAQAGQDADMELSGLT